MTRLAWTVWLLLGLLITPTVEVSAQLREVVIPVSSMSFATAAVRVAAELGIFERHGLKARVVAMESGNAAISALVSRSSEVAVAGPGELIAARSRGLPIVLVADTYRGLGASLVLSNDVIKAKGLTASAPVEDRLNALDGLLIATPSATSAYTVAFRSAAESAHATIRFTYMAQPTMMAALESGAIQGFIASAPFWAMPVARGSGTMWLSGPRADLPERSMPVSTASIQALQSFAWENPDLVDKLVTILDEVSLAVEQRPDAVKAALAKLYPDLDAKMIDILFDAEAKAWRFRPLTPADIRREIEFVKTANPSLPDVDAIDPVDVLRIKK